MSDKEFSLGAMQAQIKENRDRIERLEKFMNMVENETIALRAEVNIIRKQIDDINSNLEKINKKLSEIPTQVVAWLSTIGGIILIVLQVIEYILKQ